MKKLLSKWFLWYLKLMAQIQLFKIRPKIIGVGGASGKTSLSGFIALILSQKYKVLETRGRNSSTGIPLSIFGLKSEDYTFFYWLKVSIFVLIKTIFDWNKFDVLVAEMGIDGPNAPKNMKYLLKIVKPKVGVLTNISFEHSQYFEDAAQNQKQKILSLTSKEESLLLKSIPENGLSVVNLDDFEIKKIEGIKSKKLTVSAKVKEADFFIKTINVTISNFRVGFFSNGQNYSLNIKNPLPLHYSYSFAMAIAASTYFGFEIDESIKILEKNFFLPPGRITVFDGIKDTKIIDSSYNNATLAPIMDILDLLKKIAGKRRKVAVVGDMRELGVVSKDYHEKVAYKLIEVSDFTILIGPEMQNIAGPILKKNNHNFKSFKTFSDARETILNSIEKQDVILVKGSQNTLYLERVVEMLLKDKKDISNLCRRGKYWDKKRKMSY